MIIRLACIVNSSRKLNKLSTSTLDLLQAHPNLKTSLFLTNYPKHAISIAEQVCDDEFDVIIAVGGDGTCHEVVNGIKRSSNQNSVRFGLIPNGTGNDFQKMMGEFSPDKFLNAILSQKHQWIDLIEFSEMDQKIYALNIVGIGIDGSVVKTLFRLRKSPILKGKLAYGIAIIISFLRFKKVQVELKANEFNYSGKMMMAAMCNGKAFGHGLIIHPMAKLDNGKMGITLLGNISFLDYLKNINHVKKGKLIEHPEVFYFETDHISIHSKSNSYIESDGELMVNTITEFAIKTKGLKLIHPSFV